MGGAWILDAGYSILVADRVNQNGGGIYSDLVRFSPMACLG